MSPAPGGFHALSAPCPRRDPHATHLWGAAHTLASATSCPGIRAPQPSDAAPKH